MRELPLPFSPAMVRATLDGRKSQTRRLVRRQPTDKDQEIRLSESGWLTYRRAGLGWCSDQLSPYGIRGNRLWVREPWRVSVKYDRLAPRDLPHERGITVLFEAGGSRAHGATGAYVNDETYPETLPSWAGRRRPSMFLPRWASRITLEVTGLRVERLQEISGEDAEAEGVTLSGAAVFWPYINRGDKMRAAYETLWDSLNAKRAPWSSNPLVWVVEFRRI